jgi:recombinational DNA repair protein (RecF pathway)
MKFCDRCYREYDDDEIVQFDKESPRWICLSCKWEFDHRLKFFLIEFFNQPESSKREDLHINGDPHLKIKDVENMTKDEMREKMKNMEDIILRQYIEMTSCYICPECVGCGTPNTIEI